jgi:hypothetical protein
MANTKRSQPAGPPKPGTRPSIRVDDKLAADLAVLMATGVNLSDAIRAAVGQAADIHRTAWDQRVCAPGTAPVLLAYQLRAPRTPAPAPTSAYDAPSDAAQPRRGVGVRLPAPPAGRILRP